MSVSPAAAVVTVALLVVSTAVVLHAVRENPNAVPDAFARHIRQRVLVATAAGVFSVVAVDMTG